MHSVPGVLGFIDETITEQLDVIAARRFAVMHPIHHDPQFARTSRASWGCALAGPTVDARLRRWPKIRGFRELDLGGMLERAVANVLGDDASVAVDIAGDSRVARLILTSVHGASTRRVRINPTAGGTFLLTIPELGVGTAMFEYNDPAYMQKIVQQLVQVAALYLRGEGHVEYRRALFRRTPRLTLAGGSREWVFSRKTSRPHYPEND